MASPVANEPPDGQWLIDASGQQYYVAEFPRKEGAYQFVDPGRTKVRLTWGLVWDLAGFDEERFLLKVYRVGEQPAQFTEPPPPTQAPRAELSQVDRLRFEGFDKGLPQRGQWRQGFVLADLNEDGQVDLVHGPARKSMTGRPAIFLGDGRGNWRSWDEAVFGTAELDYGDVVVADFNGDGHQDLAFACHLRGFAVLVGDGKGNFQPWSRGLEFQLAGRGGAPPGFTSRTLRAYDWNRDGRPDLIALGEGPRLVTKGEDAGYSGGGRGLRIFINKGDGSWETRGDAIAQREYGDSLDIGDFDGDGWTDLVHAAAMPGPAKWWARGQADGSWRSATVAGVPAGAIVQAVRLVDVDGDGSLELVLGYLVSHASEWHSVLEILAGSARGEGAVRRLVLHSEQTNTGFGDIGAADLDGDAHADLAVGTGDGRILVFLGDGRGGFLREEMPENPSLSAGCRVGRVRIRDLNGDGRPELAANLAGERTSGAIGIPDLDAVIQQPGCPGAGSLRVWTVGLSAPGP